METVPTYKNTELLKQNFDNEGLPKLRDDFIAKLENALMFLDYKDLSMYHSEAMNKVSLKQFDGAWLIDISLKHEKGEGFMFKPFGDLQVTPDMFPDLNIKTMNLSGEVGHMTKYRFLTPKEKRHLDRYKYIFSEQLAILNYGEQKWWTDQTGYGFNNMYNKGDVNFVYPIQVSLKNGYYISPIDAKKQASEGLENPDSSYAHMIKHFHMNLQLALTYDYEWSCYIRETPDSLGVRIPIHPSSSKEVFIMRNIEQGSKRKKAIVNFVKDHYRTMKGFNGNERDILIRKHFRGELKFNWRGLEVHITPSPYDLRTIKTTKKFMKHD